MEDAKPWYRSLTVVPTLIATLTSWAVGMGFISPDEQSAGMTLVDSITMTIEHAMAFLAVVGLRRAVKPLIGPGSGATTIAGVGIVALLVAGCVSYNAADVLAEVGNHRGSDVISMLECEGFRNASGALVDENGPDRTMVLFGRAGELRALSEDLQRQGAVCDEIISRETLTTEQFARLRGAFDKTWTAAEGGVQ